MTSTYAGSALPPRPMLNSLAESWWLFLLRDLGAISFGVLAFIWPGATMFTLILLYGAFALADGIASVIIAIKGGPLTSRWWLAIIGGLGIVAGLLTFYWPGLTALVLLLFIAAWAIATGIMQIIGGIRLRRELDNEWLPMVSGALSVVFGLLLLARPGTGALAMILAIGVYAMAQGVLTIAFALRLRRYGAASGAPGSVSARTT